MTDKTRRMYLGQYNPEMLNPDPHGLRRNDVALVRNGRLVSRV